MKGCQRISRAATNNKYISYEVMIGGEAIGILNSRKAAN